MINAVNLETRSKVLSVFISPKKENYYLRVETRLYGLNSTNFIEVDVDKEQLLKIVDLIKEVTNE